MNNFWIRVIVGIIATFMITDYAAGQKANELMEDYIDLEFENPKNYLIEKVNVVGTETRDKNAIKSIAKLREGSSISFNSGTIGRGIKSLWSLGIFSEVEILLDSLVEEKLYLTIKLKESPVLSRFEFKGVKKAWHEELKERLASAMRVGGVISQNSRIEAIQIIQDYYKEKGYFNASTSVEESELKNRPNAVVVTFTVDRGERVKIDEIVFVGNTEVSSSKLRKTMKDTKRKKTILKKSRFEDDKYEDDKNKLIAYYNKLGFRNAEILGDSVWMNENNNLSVQINISEGNKFYFRNITWTGNSLYSDEQLSNVLGILKGDVYNKELLQKRLEISNDGRDISALYMDNGYLFFQANPTETSVLNDSIDIEMRIYEGPQATIDKVTITGNDRTNEDVIRRTLRTVPGEKFSRSDIIRSQRELLNLGYFNPENLNINTPVNIERGTVDIEYQVEETPSDQLELSAGFGGVSGLIGTLGVSFNNFSIKNITKKEAWSPLPTGDGQRLSVRYQSNGRFFRSYNASFTDPWLGGKKPNSFTIGVLGSDFNNSSFGSGDLGIFRAFVGLGSALKWPDDFFISNTLLNLETIKLDNYRGVFRVEDNGRILDVTQGNFKNFNINQTFTRSSVNQPLYPKRGSKVSLSIQFTPPYSLFRKSGYWKVSDEERQQLIGEQLISLSPDPSFNVENPDVYIETVEAARRFDFLEYHKWRFDAEWYFNIVADLVMTTSAKMGYLGNYNSELGTVPFERYALGGDGLSNQNNGINGQDIIALRGYDVNDLAVNAAGSTGATVFNKFTVELRYPLSLNPTSTIYATTYFQAGNAWNSFRDYNPFDLYRSVGVGLRVFLPMFGLLGFDYAFGLDKTIPNDPNPSLGKLSKFSIVLGFEPD